MELPAPLNLKAAQLRTKLHMLQFLRLEVLNLVKHGNTFELIEFISIHSMDHILGLPKYVRAGILQLNSRVWHDLRWSTDLHLPS